MLHSLRPVFACMVPLLVAVPAMAQLAPQTAPADQAQPLQLAGSGAATPDASASPVAPPPDVNGLAAYFDNWSQRVAEARATQPHWSSPLLTTYAGLEERVRVDTQFQHSGNNTDTIDLDGTRGVDLIVGQTEEVQLSLPPYFIRTAEVAKNEVTGWNDWPVFRFKQRLLSSPSDQDDYVVSAWLQVGLPTGVRKLTNHAITLSPTLGFGKGFGNFVVQGTVGGLIPTAYEGKLGNQIVTNLAFQYHVLTYFWPQLEMNWTNYEGGPRAHLNQVFLTPGVNVAHIELSHDVNMTVGVGYQVAVAPDYRAKPLTPSYDRAWILSTRVNF